MTFLFYFNIARVRKSSYNLSIFPNIFMNGNTTGIPQGGCYSRLMTKTIYTVRCYLLIENIQIQVFKVLIQILDAISVKANV